MTVGTVPTRIYIITQDQSHFPVMPRAALSRALHDRGRKNEREPDKYAVPPLLSLMLGKGSCLLKNIKATIDPN